jgi:hypothetical protein
MKMNYEVAVALVEAALETEPLPLSDADVVVLSRFNPEAFLSELADCFDTVYVHDGRRFILGVDGDCYIVEWDRAFYIPVESALGGPVEICGEAL